MGYDDRDDRRYNDELPPRRPRGDRGQPPDRGDRYHDEPRSGSPSRPRNSRPRDDDAPRSGTPSRSRSGDTPPRTSRPRDYDDPRSGTPSRSRSGDTPSRSRSYDERGDIPASGTRDRGSARGGARDAMRKMRDRLTGAYEAVSREVRSIGRRDESRSATPSRTQRDAPPTRNREYIDEPRSYDDVVAPPARPSRSVVPGATPAAAALAARDAHNHSLAMRLINRRRRMRVGKVNPALRALGITAITLLALLIIVGGGTGVGYSYAVQQQYETKIEKLGLSRDLQSSRIYDRHGQLLYQTFSQTGGTRDYLDYCEIPQLIQQATTDTEDHTFWQNNGVDPTSVLRALVADVTHSGGTGTQGGSTITQQLVKLAVLGDSSQNIGRKIDEAILAFSVNDHYTKQDILTMYLNIVPYGYNNEGIEAAAESYFHLFPVTIKDAQHISGPIQQRFVQSYTACMKDRGEAVQYPLSMSGAYQLQPWQATLLAGVPNNPNVYNPYVNYDNLAVERQYGGVLVSMRNYGDSSYFQQWDAAGNVVGQLNAEQMEAYTEQQLVPVADPKTGKKETIFPNQYQGTSNAMLAPYFVQYVIQQITQEYFPNNPDGFASAGWDVYTTLDYGDPKITTAQLASISINPCTSCADAGKLMTTLPNTGDWLDRVGLQQYAEYVVTRNIASDFPDYWYCKLQPLSHPDPNRPYIDPTPATNPFSYNQQACWETPLNGSYTNVADGALTAIDPRNGDILAMVGGVNYNSTDARAGGQNNLATANRSLGSSFKPIVYATAMQMGWYPGMVISDQPTCFPAGGTSSEARPADAVLCPKDYLPHNDEAANWAGPEPLRILLGNSLNTPAEMALSYVGLGTTANPSPLISMAQRLGITSLSEARMGYTTAIGTQEVPLLEETSAYGTFANGGVHQTPRALLSILTVDGKVILSYNPSPAGYQAISPQASYMITSILTDNSARVADFGWDNPLHFEGRDVAAKTGTSDAQKDIVTVGYTPWLALGVWSGNADGESMQNIIGIAGAGYIFHDVMAFAINRLDMPGTLPSRFAPLLPGGYFKIPDHMHLAVLNCNTGLAPWKGMDVTDKKSYCDPSTQDRVPAALSIEFAHCGDATKVPPPYPNTALNCGGNPTTNAILDEWEAMDWGNKNQGVQTDGIDISWMIDGQDPTVP